MIVHENNIIFELNDTKVNVGKKSIKINKFQKFEENKFKRIIYL